MRDEWFMRGSVPMTKSEVRAVSISKLELSRDSVLYDVGAGTGSVSVEAARYMPAGQVYAVERSQEAADLIRKNKERFDAVNVTIVEGEAPGSLAALPTATHAFLGGTGGHMEEIVTALWKKNPGMRIVANIITLENLSRLLELVKKREIPAEVVCLQVSRAWKAGGSHLMRGENPVYVISMGGEVKDGIGEDTGTGQPCIRGSAEEGQRAVEPCGKTTGKSGTSGGGGGEDSRDPGAGENLY